LTVAPLGPCGANDTHSPNDAMQMQCNATVLWFAGQLSHGVNVMNPMKNPCWGRREGGGGAAPFLLSVSLVHSERLAVASSGSSN
jgi:hypothetical protein